ncbi:hypothetical protein BX600DRAFT_531919 [Xylariales sp. PMI_506]|nr:hypothetical protein BX600DRAFT_531919 [Xylariales sp. PMI_506]
MREAYHYELAHDTNHTGRRVRDPGRHSSIPIVIVLCVLYYLHRRTAKRHKREDEVAKYKSLDFGMGEGVVKGGKRKSKLFGGGEKEAASHTKGLSMDMNLSSPYLLPPDLHQSRESLYSLAKTLHQNEDPYRHVDSFIASDAASMRSFPKGMDKRSSTYTAHTAYSGRDMPRVQSNQNLPPRQKSLPTGPLPQIPTRAQEPTYQEPPVPQPTHPITPLKNDFRFTDDDIPVPQVGGTPVHPVTDEFVAMPDIQEPAPVAQKNALPNRNSRPASFESIKPEHAYAVNDRDSSALPASDLYRVTGSGLGIMESTSDRDELHISAPAVNSLPPRKDSRVISDVPSEYEDFARHLDFDRHDVHEHVEEPRGGYLDMHADHHVQEEPPLTAGLAVPQQNQKRLSVGFRPLPPDELLESEDPEYRANRIRSFYKEYFDDSKEERPPLPQPQSVQYYEDYDAGYGGDGAYFDPETNAFVMPYAQPVTRRAMTPPPNNRRPMPGPRQRGPPGPMGPPGPQSRPRAGSTMSGGRFGTASPRPGSSASARMGGRTPGPRKPMPPPAALTTLPTPSKLKDDALSILNPLDFAPPPTFKDKARGRSQSPLGERRPYQLTVPVSSPLVSSFDDMAALPSPHLLRKSGTFTALDFAPPRRFKDPDSMSDAGSVRSMGSGISSRNAQAIRGGAGRVSRLPGDAVFTAAAMGDQLKPKWGMRD